MKVLPSIRTIVLMFVAAGLFGFNSAIAFRSGSTGRAGFYAVMASLWAVLGFRLNQKRRNG